MSPLAKPIRVALGATIFAAVAMSACVQATPQTPACQDIPAGGCPDDGADVCADPSCVAVYACSASATWVKSKDCPARIALVDAGADATDAASEAAPFVRDAAIDAPPGAFGGVGCEPLEAPDCTLGLALSCGADCCDCEDLYICENGGWTSWGTCSGGTITQKP